MNAWMDTMRAVMVLAMILGCTTIVRCQTSSASRVSRPTSVERPSDPPVPAMDASPEWLRTWASRYVDKGAFVETDIDADRVYLYNPTSFTSLPDGHVIGIIRAELFRPRVVKGLSVRSVRKKVEIDCSALRYRELVVEGFAGSNLKRPVPGLPMTDAWTAPASRDSGPGRRLYPACGNVGAAR